MSKNKNVITINENLKKDLKKYASNFAIGIATTVRDELTETARLAIESFYADYTPKPGNVNSSHEWKYITPNGVPLSYKRHYSNFLDNSFFKYYYNPHNQIIKGGVMLSSDALDDIYRADKDYIFSLVYSGFHGNMDMIKGNPASTPPLMNPSPMEIILEKQKEIISEIDNYKKDGINRANKGNYSTLALK